jgi:hypothetical protein
VWGGGGWGGVGGGHTLNFKRDNLFENSKKSMVCSFVLVLYTLCIKRKESNAHCTIILHSIMSDLGVQQHMHTVYGKAYHKDAQAPLLKASYTLGAFLQRRRYVSKKH